MTWNLMHLPALLRREGGLPTEGNQREAAGRELTAAGQPNSEYR